MNLKAVLGFLSFVSLCLLNVVHAEPLLVVNQLGVGEPSSQVVTIGYGSFAFQFSSGDMLRIAVDPTDQICLYSNYPTCNADQRCTTAADVHTTSFDLSTNGGSFSAGVTVAGLNVLARQGGGSATNYNCLKGTIDYSTKHNTSLNNPPSTINCQLASTGTGSDATFVGGGSSGSNPCAGTVGTVTFSTGALRN